MSSLTFDFFLIDRNIMCCYQFVKNITSINIPIAPKAFFPIFDQLCNDSILFPAIFLYNLIISIYATAEPEQLFPTIYVFLSFFLLCISGSNPQLFSQKILMCVTYSESLRFFVTASFIFFINI